MQYFDYDQAFIGLIYAHLQIPKPSVDFHLHDGCEIYLLLSGDVNYFVEKMVYTMRHGDIILTNSHEIHKPAFLSDQLYERVTLEFDPSMIQPFSTSEFDLLGCFYNKPAGERNKLSLPVAQMEEMLRLVRKMDSLYSVGCDQGNVIMKLATLLEMLVLLNRNFYRADATVIPAIVPDKIQCILEYIGNHLEEPLTLELLEKQFFINRFHLCKLFKRYTGSSLHSYIVFKRISMAKKLLADGRNASETGSMCGFNDYSNFLKMFKKIVGISPLKYKKQLGLL